MFTNYSIKMHNINTIIKFADNMFILCLIMNSNESAYRQETQVLARWMTTTSLSMSERQKR
ncbi:hypothetical protein LDENG_00060670 [Lucifuga dentata]|nr:hypothetical protein LDENG_00060670 [Lucifuga dentata]